MSVENNMFYKHGLIRIINPSVAFRVLRSQ